MIAVCDTETLGLDPDRHPVWEIAVIRWDETTDTVLSEDCWQVAVGSADLAAAEPAALDINGFHERYDPDAALPRPDAMRRLIDLTEGRAHLAGAVIYFDEERLRRACLAVGLTPDWHYHLIDVEAEARGYLRGRETALRMAGWRLDQRREVAWSTPWCSDDISAALRLPPIEGKHTALGDARWALQMLRATYGLPL